MGQTRSVYVKHLYVRRSVEETAMELARRTHMQFSTSAVPSGSSIAAEHVDLQSWDATDVDFLFSM